MDQGTKLDEKYIARALMGDERRAAWEIEHQESFRQLSLFEDFPQ